MRRAQPSLLVAMAVAWHSVVVATAALHSGASVLRPAPAVGRVAQHHAAMKLSKQQELARLMEQARLQKEGLVPEAAPPPPNAKSRAKQKPNVPPKRPPTREQLSSAFEQMRASAGGDQLTSGSNLQLKYGMKKKMPQATPQRTPLAPRAPASSARPQQLPSSADAAAQYSYDDFSQLLKGAGGWSQRKSRVLSDEALPTGTLLPLPRSMSSLDGVPSAFESFDALASAANPDAPPARTVVVIASMSTFMSERLRQTLVGFAGSVPAARLDAALVSVSRVPPSTLRKLARKGKVHCTPWSPDKPSSPD